MLCYGVTYLVTLVVFGAMDALWLGLVSAAMYRQTLGDILLDKFRIGPAMAFYLLNIVGLMVFAVPKGPLPKSWQHALLFGALYGIFTYATYDLTNYATLRVWTLRLTVTDVIWGACVSGVATAVGVIVVNWIQKKVVLF